MKRVVAVLTGAVVLLVSLLTVFSALAGTDADGAWDGDGLPAYDAAPDEDGVSQGGTDTPPAGEDTPAGKEVKLTGGTESVRVAYEARTYTLSIGECGFTDREKTTYGVTVKGYDIRTEGSGPVPFRTAIAWSPEEYIPVSLYGPADGGNTEAYFQVPADAPAGEPKYIIVAPRDKELPWGDYYVIGDGKFYPGSLFAGEEPTPEPTATPEPTPSPTPVPTGRDALRVPGAAVAFGRYPQEAGGTDRTPVRWRVLAYDGENNRALLISEKVLDVMPWHYEDDPAVRWEGSGIRQWLNTVFLNSAFSVKEQGAILPAEVDNSAGQQRPDWVTDGGNNTEDRVFLLSWHEAAEVYFPPQEARQAQATGFAEDKFRDNPAYLRGGDTVSWWLRSPGNTEKNACMIYENGNDTYERYALSVGVRPALWVNADEDVFDLDEPAETPGPDPAQGQAAVPGGTVLFGHYPRTADGLDRPPVEWLVLASDEPNHKALLISKDVLDAQIYHYREGKEEVTWEGSFLRKWLNSAFLNTAFSPEEQGALIETETDGCADKVFLLSREEADPKLGLFSGAVGSSLMAADATEYAAGMGASGNSLDKETLPDGKAPCSWWLLTKYDNANAYEVSSSQWCRQTGMDLVNGIRPVIRVDTASEAFRTPAAEEAPAQAPAAVDPAADSEALRTVGAYVKFGNFPQTAGDEDRTPAEWLVLAYDAENHRTLLLSRYGLDALPYNEKEQNVTWEKSSLRKWLNKEFTDMAFTPEEQAALLENKTDNGAEQGYYSATKKKAGKNTKDKVFLLSWQEVKAYLPAGGDRRCAVTDYAAGYGAGTDERYRLEGRGTEAWWLRSPGASLKEAAMIDRTGKVNNRKVNQFLAVRPAVWVDTEAEVFR